MASSETDFSPIKLGSLTGSHLNGKENIHGGSPQSLKLTKSSLDYTVLAKDRRNTIQSSKLYETPPKRYKRGTFTSPRAILGTPSAVILRDTSSKPTLHEDKGHLLTSPLGSAPVLKINELPNLLKVPERSTARKSHLGDGIVLSLPSTKPLVMALHEFNSSPLRKVDDPPVFTVQYVKELQDEHYTRIELLQKSVVDKNAELISSSQQLTELKHALLLHEQELLDLTDRLRRQTEENSAGAVERDHLKTKVDSLLQDVEFERNRLMTSSDAWNTEKDDLLRSIQEKSETIRALAEESSFAESRLADKDAQITRLAAEVGRMERNVEAIQAENDKLHSEISNVRSSSDQLQLELREMTEQRGELEMSSLLLESRLKEKEASLKVLDDQFKSIVLESKALHDDMAQFEDERRIAEQALADVSAQLERQKAISGDLELQVAGIETENQSLHNKLQAATEERRVLEDTVADFQSQVDRLRAQCAEKDSMISGDTKKLGELVKELEAQKAVIADYKQSAKTDGAERSHSDASLLQQLHHLKEQVKLNQQTTDKRIQEVAELLYLQYSKKHETKVGQLKRKYESKLEEKNLELAECERRADQLQNHLQLEIKEKALLLRSIETGDYSAAMKIHARADTHT